MLRAPDSPWRPQGAAGGVHRPPLRRGLLLQVPGPAPLTPLAGPLVRISVMGGECIGYNYSRATCGFCLRRSSFSGVNVPPAEGKSPGFLTRDGEVSKFSLHGFARRRSQSAGRERGKPPESSETCVGFRLRAPTGRNFSETISVDPISCAGQAARKPDFPSGQRARSPGSEAARRSLGSGGRKRSRARGSHAVVIITTINTMTTIVITYY